MRLCILKRFGIEVLPKIKEKADDAMRLVEIRMTKSHHEGKEPLWPDEISINKVKYPYGWNFEVLHILNQEEWTRNSISLRGLNVQFFSGINPILNRKSLENLIVLIKEKWSLIIYNNKD